MTFLFRNFYTSYSERERMAESSHKSDWSVDNTVQMMLHSFSFFA
jgi:hypothetical protein